MWILLEQMKPIGASRWSVTIALIDHDGCEARPVLAHKNPFIIIPIRTLPQPGGHLEGRQRHKLEFCVLHVPLHHRVSRDAAHLRLFATGACREEAHDRLGVALEHAQAGARRHIPPSWCRSSRSRRCPPPPTTQMHVTASRWPSSVSSSWPWRASHTRTVVSSEHEKSLPPSADSRTSLTPSSAPRASSRSRPRAHSTRGWFCPQTPSTAGRRWRFRLLRESFLNAPQNGGSPAWTRGQTL